jgi:hypothetical protein
VKVNEIKLNETVRMKTEGYDVICCGGKEMKRNRTNESNE